MPGDAAIGAGTEAGSRGGAGLLRARSVGSGRHSCDYPFTGQGATQFLRLWCFGTLLRFDVDALFRITLRAS